MNQANIKDLKKEWLKTSVRRMSYQKMRLYQHGLYHGYRDIFGRRQHYFFTRVRKGNVWLYIENRDTKKQMQYLERKFSDVKYVAKDLKQLQKAMGKDFQRCEQDIKKIPQYWKNVKNITLLKALEKYYEIDNRVSGYYWVLFNDIENILTDSVKKIMAKRGLEQDEIERVLAGLSQPAACTPLDMERSSILRVALKKDKVRASALLKHHKEFAFLPMYDVGHEEYPVGHFKKELERIFRRFSQAEIEKEIDSISKKYLTRKKKRDEIIGKYKPFPEMVSILEFYATYAVYKDRKLLVRDRISYYVKNLFKEIARRLDLSLAEILFLTGREIEGALKGTKKIYKDDAASRVEDSAYFLKDDKVTIFTEKRDLKIIDSILEKKEKLKELKGVKVFPGKVQGIVAIIFSNADFDYFRKGQILIASATRPDFVPIMKKSAAIVTDEGGLLSHAAIVSRELKVPCIVGTKKATQILKDGDLVEVDANKGIVRILKRK